MDYISRAGTELMKYVGGPSSLDMTDVHDQLNVWKWSSAEVGTLSTPQVFVLLENKLLHIKFQLHFIQAAKSEQKLSEGWWAGPQQSAAGAALGLDCLVLTKQVPQHIWKCPTRNILNANDLSN